MGVIKVQHLDSRNSCIMVMLQMAEVDDGRLEFVAYCSLATASSLSASDSMCRLATNS